MGVGGMGEVYRARDTKLDRDVALKILPEPFASDPDRLMRFEREGNTLAVLNHPQIAQIYGFEQSGATSALVMELVEGEDLAQRVARGLASPKPHGEGGAIRSTRRWQSRGPVQILCDLADAFGGSWSSENVIVFSGPDGLMRLASAGGVATPLTTVDRSRGELSHRWPFFLPGVRNLVYLRVAATEKTIFVRSLDGTRDQRVVESDSKAEYSAGHDGQSQTPLIVVVNWPVSLTAHRK